MHTVQLNSILTTPGVNINRKPGFKPKKLAYKSDTVTFSGQKTNEKISDIEKELLFSAKQLNIRGSDKDDIINKLIYTCTKFDKIGNGAEASIYPVPFSDLVLKAYYNLSYQPAEKEASFEISDIDKLNGVLYKKDRYCIMGKIQGADLRKALDGKGMYEYSLIAGSMPQRAYDEFLKKTCQIHNLGCCYDNLGKNMIIDYKNEKFMPFDLTSYKNECAIINYTADFNNNNFSKIKIDPIGCIMSTVGIRSDHPCYDNALLKTLKSVADDFENYNMFDTSESGAYINNDKNSSQIAKIFDNFNRLQVRKVSLSKQGLSNSEIKDKLKEDTKKFDKDVDELYDASKDCPKEAFYLLNTIIDLKHELSSANRFFSRNAVYQDNCNDFESLYSAYTSNLILKQSLTHKLMMCIHELEDNYQITLQS